MRERTVLVIVVVLILSCLGCTAQEKGSNNSTLKTAEVQKETLKGEWKVIGVSCLDILAEKDGKRKIFEYHVPTGLEWLSLIERVLYCRKTVKPGWIVQVESESSYAFFPPKTPKTEDKTHQKNKQSSKATKR